MQDQLDLSKKYSKCTMIVHEAKKTSTVTLAKARENTAIAVYDDSDNGSSKYTVEEANGYTSANVAHK